MKPSNWDIGGPGQEATERWVSLLATFFKPLFVLLLPLHHWNPQCLWHPRDLYFFLSPPSPLIATFVCLSSQHYFLAMWVPAIFRWPLHQAPPPPHWNSEIFLGVRLCTKLCLNPEGGRSWYFDHGFSFGRGPPWGARQYLFSQHPPRPPWVYAASMGEIVCAVIFC